MRVFKVKDRGKWAYQNRALYTGAFFEGSLLDNFILACKRGYVAVYESYVNPNQSEYIYKFAAYKDHRAVAELWSEFLKRKEEYLEYERSIA